MAISKDMRKLKLLSALAEKTEVRQVDLVSRLGLAVWPVNWYLKRFVAKSCIMVKRIGRWHLSYVLTPKGMAEKVQQEPAGWCKR